ncbi:ArsR family transcriptional regulator [Methanobrevibacter sp.]|uniref:ArsR family transcriptional regulator n=1 Tax=Methanobrevibacter sp. TaxID=66852 RepID=UPI0038905804
MRNKYIETNYKNSEMTKLLLGRKGGRTTIRIIDQLLIRPYNMNQLSKILKLDYKTIKYHMHLILKLNLVEGDVEEYGSLYFPSKKLINNLNEYEQIKKYLNNL